MRRSFGGVRTLGPGNNRRLLITSSGSHALSASSRVAAIVLLALARVALAAGDEPPTQPDVITLTRSSPEVLHADQSWIYRQDTERDGRHGPAIRSEVTTAYQHLSGSWMTALMPLDDPRVAGGPAPALRMLGFIDERGCMFDLMAGQSLQAPPCTKPVAAGDAWSVPAYLERREFKAIGKETIRVPAGTFDAMRVEGVESRQATPAQPIAPVVRTVYWYAPRVAGMVRVERDYLGADGKVTTHQVQELESFGPASEATRIAVRATPQWQANEVAKAWCTHASSP